MSEENKKEITKEAVKTAKNKEVKAVKTTKKQVKTAEDKEVKEVKTTKKAVKTTKKAVKTTKTKEVQVPGSPVSEKENSLGNLKRWFFLLHIGGKMYLLPLFA